MGPGLGLGMGMGGGGPGSGPRARARDDKPLVKERTRGKVGASGEINEMQTFQGIPEEGDAKVALTEMVRSASQQAEEALGQEEIPRKRRDAVQKYFDGVKPK